VLGVLYVDSEQQNFFGSEELILSIAEIVQGSLQALGESLLSNSEGFANEPLPNTTVWPETSPVRLGSPLTALELLSSVAPPTLMSLESLNLESTDFAIPRGRRS